MKIAVAMSGGVDSSVAAALLQRDGHEIVGFTMRHFDNKRFGFSEYEGCDIAITDAKKICKQLNIEHVIIDVRNEFNNIIIQNFIDEYHSGATPNPCTICNPTIKWGAFFDKVMAYGMDKFATGHYSKIINIKDKFAIAKSEDIKKDQTYMLWGLKSKQIKKTLFPLSEHTKDEIRKIALKLKLVVAQNKDSQEICFIKNHYEEFLTQHLTVKQGNILFKDGRVIGKHKGYPFYTIGQRRGLNTPWSTALYVEEIDAETNTVKVTDDSNDLLRQSFFIENINWVLSEKPDSRDLTVQIRYNSGPVEVASLTEYDEKIKVDLKKPARAISPGQSAVFYKDNILLGGGIIRKVVK